MYALRALIWVFCFSLMVTLVLTTVGRSADINSPGIAGTGRIQNEVMKCERTSTIHFLKIEPTVLFVGE